GTLPGIRRHFVETTPAASRHDHGLRSNCEKRAVDPVVAEGTDDAIAVFEQPGQRDLHVDRDAELDDPVLETADHFQAGAITDVTEAPIGVGTESALQDAAVGGPV